VAHQVTNVMIEEAAGDRVRISSKGLGVMADGSCGSVTYEDVVIRLDAGWRICHRKVVPRRVPLSGLGRQA
jgi:hypothetical protein